MRILLCLAFVASVFAQSQPQPLNKDMTQGYSKDIEDQKDPKTTLNHPKVLFKTNEQAKPVEVPADLQSIVQKQFAPECTVAIERSTIQVNYVKPVKEVWTPFLEADLDGDGVPDAIIAARCPKIVSLAAEHGFRLADPYYAANGYGDPKVTSEFASVDPEGGVIVLVMLGQGKDGWRAEQPKARWALINLPFDNLGVSQVVNKKRHGMAVLLESKDEQDSVAYFDGKKWKWREVAENR